MSRQGTRQARIVAEYRRRQYGIVRTLPAPPQRNTELHALDPPMETPASIEAAKHILHVFGIIIVAGLACGLLARKTRLPDVAILLIAGMLLGPAGAGWINVKTDSTLNQLILIFGSSYILFDGGASLRLSVLKGVWITITALATLGVIITAAITGLAAHWILGLPLVVALLLAAAIASTDPATLVPVFRQIKIKDRVAQTVMSESAFNDATGAILTFAVLAVASGGAEFSTTAALTDLLWQSLIGIIAGGVLGYLAAFVIAHEKYDFLVEYAPIVSLMAVVGAYLGADNLQASGFMAVFVFGIMLGNKDIFGFTMEPAETKQLDDFVMTTAFVMRMFIFILLGSQVDFSLIGENWVGGVMVVLVMMLIARPLTVFACALPDRRARWNWREMLFMCWTRETGVIPGALAGMLLGMHAPGAPVIASVTFIAILMTILIQATTTRWLAKKLGLLVAG
jgi:cell volume regulation protein A